MNRDRDTDVVILLRKRMDAAQELLKLMKESTDFDNEAVFTANIDKRQRLLDNVVLLDRELAELARKNDTETSGFPEAAALSRKTDAVIRQIQLIMKRDIEQVKRNMAVSLDEAKKLRKRKSGLVAYRINGTAAQKQRLDLRGQRARPARTRRNG